MCNWGTETIVRVKMAAELSHTGEERWADKGIDSCIAPIVRALQEAGIDMRSSCCGHGKRDGSILLADGRTLVIKPDRRMDFHGTFTRYDWIEGYGYVKNNSDPGDGTVEFVRRCRIISGDPLWNPLCDATGTPCS